jgi:NitT/TauT family transport system permease protein
MGKLRQSAFIIIPFLIWYALTFYFPPRILPDPVTTVLALADLARDGILLPHLLDTLRRAASGFAIGAALGSLLGIFMGIRREANAFFDPIIIIFLAFPALGWTLIALLWFGLSELSAIFFVTVLSFPVFAINVREGVRAIDADLINMAQSFRATGRKVVRSILVPTILPFLMSGTRYGLNLAWKLTAIAELVGMQTGVGFQINFNFGRFQMTPVFAWTLSLTIVILLVDNLLLKPLEQRTFRWRAAIAE